MTEVRWLGRVGYDRGLALQEELAGELRAGRAADTLLLLEHDPVFTIGRTRDRSSLGLRELLPHPVREISRGGQATYHGPGQLVGYPVLDLTRRGRDLHRHLRALEEYLIKLCAGFGVAAARREALTGAWVAERKIASIGVGVRQWISRHGFALNVTRDSLAGFAHIVPCGISEVQMTCLEAEANRAISMEEVVEAARNLPPL